MEKKPNFDNFKAFLEKFKTSDKAKTLGFISVRNYYEYLTKRKAHTKTFKETKHCRFWMLNIWRPFSKTLTNADWEHLGVSPVIGRGGYISVFRYKGMK